MRQRRRIVPADLVIVGSLTGILWADKMLVEHGQLSVSERHGQLIQGRLRWVVLIWWAYLMLHLHAEILPLPKWMSRVDPFHLIAERIRARRA